MLRKANRSTVHNRKVKTCGGKEVVTPLNKVLHLTVYKILWAILVHFDPEKVISPCNRRKIHY